jgi:hypothetical protein
LRNSLIEGPAKDVLIEEQMNPGGLPYGYILNDLQDISLTAHVKRDHVNHVIQKVE